MAHVVIVGGGFGGLNAAMALKRVPVRVTLVDRANYHLFQPLLYQVATSGLSTSEVAVPIRGVLSKQSNTTVLLDEAVGFDLERRQVILRDERPLDYDFLIVAAGSRTNYFGHLEWSRWGPGLKDLDDALEIRRRVLLAFEVAEREPDPELRRKLLSFVVIGGGPTGVEMAGALSELARFTLSRDFRNAKVHEARVTLVEALPRILPPFDEELSAVAARHLNEMGVEVLTGKMVTAVDEQGVHFGSELLEAGTVVWAAGVEARPLASKLGAERDRKGGVVVEPDCSLPGHPEVFVIGDMASFEGEDGKPLPGLAPVAMQQGKYVARAIHRTLTGRDRLPFKYNDRGMLATIGRSRAVIQTDRLKMDGRAAWITWLVIHVWYLIGFRNRLAVMADWAYSYFTYRRGARLITGRRLEAGAPRPGGVVEPSEIERAAQERLASEEQVAPSEQPPIHH